MPLALRFPQLLEAPKARWFWFQRPRRNRRGLAKQPRNTRRQMLKFLLPLCVGVHAHAAPSAVDYDVVV